MLAQVAHITMAQQLSLLLLEQGQRLLLLRQHQAQAVLLHQVLHLL
jgi:hypothetical protein